MAGVQASVPGVVVVKAHRASDPVMVVVKAHQAWDHVQVEGALDCGDWILEWVHVASYYAFYHKEEVQERANSLRGSVPSYLSAATLAVSLDYGLLVNHNLLLLGGHYHTYTDAHNHNEGVVYLLAQPPNPNHWSPENESHAHHYTIPERAALHIQSSKKGDPCYDEIF